MRSENAGERGVSIKFLPRFEKVGDPIGLGQVYSKFRVSLQINGRDFFILYVHCTASVTSGNNVN